MSFTPAKPANFGKYMSVSLPYIPRLTVERGTTHEMVGFTLREFYESAIPADYGFRELIGISITVPECDLIRANEECIPDTFSRLINEGRLEELEALKERCYVTADHIRKLVECFRTIIEFLKRFETNG